MTPEEIVERAAEVLFPIIHPHAARAIKTGEGVAEYDQTHVRAAEALADAGLLPTEVETATYSMADSDEPLGKVRRYVTPWEVTP